MKTRKPAPVPRPAFWFASALFFVSGGTGLIYQVAWFKRFAHVWGSTSLAFAAVAGSFLFGLGLGAWLIGRLADRIPRPLRLYGQCELAIGVLALLIPFEIAWLVEASARIHGAMPARPLLRYLFEFGITLVVIGPPCVLMGGTLPLLIRQLTARQGTLSEATGWLYAVNTLGAALGCYVAGFHLLPVLGLLATNNLAAGLSMAVGLAALRLGPGSASVAQGSARPVAKGTTPAPKPAGAPAARPVAVSASAAPPPIATTEPPTPTHRAAYGAAALTGFGALVLEMTWGRQLALVLGGSTYAFSATLFVVLLGIAIGSFVFHRWLRPVAASPMVSLVTIGVLMVTTLLGKWALPWLSEALGSESVRAMRAEPFGNGAVCVGASLVLELLPSLAMGVLFPLLVHLTRAAAARVGATVGNVYAWNTGGSIAGASLTAVLLFPVTGTAGAMAVAAAAYVVALMIVVPWSSARDRLVIGGAALAGAVVVALLARPIDPRLTNMGMYFYGGPEQQVLDIFAGKSWKAAITPLVFREGASSNVLVSRMRGGIVSLRVNGKVDASTSTDMETQLGLAYFPRCFAPRARDVLVIGFGSGTTCGASLLFPGTRVTCCEIEPEVLKATEAFGEVNHHPERQSGFSIRFVDGRTAIQGSDRTYDLIISEPSNPWLAGVSNLFTREFFRAARQRLNAGGILAQWVQAYNFTLGDYVMILRTMRSEFPHVGVVMMADGLDTVLLASTRPLFPDPGTLGELQEIVNQTPALAYDLRNRFGGTDVRRLLVRRYVLGEEQVDRLIRADPSGALNQDLHLRLEFDAPLHLFRRRAEDQAILPLLRSVDPAWIERLAMGAGIARESAEFQVALGEHLLDRIATPKLAAAITQPGDLDRAAAHFDAALKLRPDLASAARALARTRLLQERKDEAIAAFERAVSLEPGDAVTRGDLGQELFNTGRFAEAEVQLREALRLQGHVSVVDGSAAWANNLAWMLATCPDPKLRNGAEAMDWAERVRQSDGGDNPGSLDTYGVVLAELGRFDEAIHVMGQIRTLVPDHVPSVEAVEGRIKQYEARQPVRMQ